MANYAIQFVATAGTVSSTGPTLDASQEQKFLDWVWDAYPQYEADGETPKAKTNANIADSIRDMHAAIWRGIVNNVKRHDEIAAAQAAKDGVTELPGDVT